MMSPVLPSSLGKEPGFEPMASLNPTFYRLLVSARIWGCNRERVKKRSSRLGFALNGALSSK